MCDEETPGSAQGFSGPGDSLLEKPGVPGGTGERQGVGDLAHIADVCFHLTLPAQPGSTTGMIVHYLASNPPSPGGARQVGNTPPPPSSLTGCSRSLSRGRGGLGRRGLPWAAPWPARGLWGHRLHALLQLGLHRSCLGDGLLNCRSTLLQLLWHELGVGNWHNARCTAKLLMGGMETVHVWKQESARLTCWSLRMHSWASTC